MRRSLGKKLSFYKKKKKEDEKNGKQFTQLIERYTHKYSVFLNPQPQLYNY